MTSHRNVWFAFGLNGVAAKPWKGKALDDMDGKKGGCASSCAIAFKPTQDCVAKMTSRDARLVTHG